MQSPPIRNRITVYEGPADNYHNMAMGVRVLLLVAAKARLDRLKAKPAVAQK